MVGNLRLQLLGEFALSDCARPRRLPPAAQRVLVFCALHDQVSARQVVAGRLWPDVSEDAAARRLRTSLWRVSAVSPSAIASDRSSVHLADDVEVDLRTVRQTDLVEPPRVVGSSEDGLLTLFQRDLLPSWDDEWLIPERERWRQQRLHALERAAWALGLAGRHADAVDVALTAIEIEPLRESAHRTLVRLHLAEGNVSEARRHADQFVSLCRAELGVEPSLAFRELVGGAGGS